MNDDKVGSAQITGGDTVTLSGSNTFDPGLVGTNGSQALRDFNVLGGNQYLDSSILTKGSQNGTASYVDPITGSTRTVNVFVNSQMSTSLFGDQAQTLYEPVGNQQYIDARIATVDSTGGTLNIQSTGPITIAAKQTTLFQADGTGDAASRLSWLTPGDTSIVMNGATLPSNPAPGQNTVSSTALAGWPTTVTVDGTVYSITNLADYQAFNTTLIGLIQTGALDQAGYDDYMAQAANLGSGSVKYEVISPLPDPSDDIWKSVGTRSVMHADGANASAEIAAGSKLTVSGANGGVLRATAGATVANAGTIVSNDGVSIYLSDKSVGTNTGVISARGSATGVNTTGSSFTNDNIINKGIGSNSNAITATNSVVTNNAIINLGTSASSSNTSAYGVNITGGSFTNSAAATIYIGRGEQTDPNAPAADVALNLGGNLAGINVNSGASVQNQGAIVIGTKTQGAAGIRVDSATDVQVDNSGSITVKGMAAAVPRLNTGLYVRNAGTDGSSSITNSGSILLEGVNAIGMQIIADGAGKSASATSTGSITVAGGADPSSGTRNFGAWVEGANGGAATSEITGPVALTGIGAIGVHARGNAEVTVLDTATVQFNSGTDQIGYFIYGAEASISVLRNTLEVNTERSTLFRVADGASFDGSQYIITASGKDSLGVLGTGTGTKIETKGSTYYLTGDGATAVTVEGGATGTIDSATRIFLNAANTVGGIADGQQHDIYGNPVGSPNPTTTLTNAAILSSSAAGVNALIARNAATVKNSGAVSLSGANSIGLLAETSGKVDNSATVTVDGSGSAGLVAQTQGLVSNSGEVLVKGSASFGLLAQNQGKVVNAASGTVTVTAAGATALAALDQSRVENHAKINANAANTTGILVSKSTGSNDGDIELAFANSTGIRADAGTIVTAGKISSAGANSVGMIAVSGGKITNSGDLSMSGASSVGLAALSSSTITSTGDITLTGAASYGLYGETGGRIEATGSSIVVNGAAIAAANGTSTFVLKDVEAQGSVDVLYAASGAQTSVTATSSLLAGRATTEAGASSTLDLIGSTWQMPADSNVTDLINDGSRIVFASPSTGGFKTLTVDNAYTGTSGSTLVMSTTLNDGLQQLTDKMVVHGTTSGRSILDISNYNGLGAYTPGDGIKVVQVDGASNGTFDLARDLFAGAFEYDLFKGGRVDPNDGDWYLRSSLTGGAQTVEPYAESLTKFGQLSIGTLQQRTGNRLWPDDAPASGLITKAPAKAPPAGGSDVVGSGVWGRVLGLTGSNTPTQGTGYDQNLWFGQAGIDGALYETRDGALVAGIMGTYGNQSLDVAVSPNPATLLARQGKISTEAYGIGGSLTWIGTDGVYVDGVAQYTWYDSDLTASGFAPLAKGNGGAGYGLSLEAGRRYVMSGGWTWVPQVQMIYSSVGFDDFVYMNPDGGLVSVSGGGGESLLGRAGVRFENLSRTTGGGRFQGYGIINLTYEFLGGTDVFVSGTQLSQQSERLWGEVGLGGTWALNDRFSLYGEGLYSTALADVGASYTVRGMVGIRANW